MTDEEYLRNRLDRLNQNSHYGIMIDTEITDIVRSHIKRLEETKMNATSTEEFKDIIAIDFELQTFPNPDVQDKFIVSATNRDDIFAFVFEGPNIVDTCRKTGLFAGWEKDQKIRELETDVSRWKKEAADCLRLRDEAQKEAYKLKKENEKYEEQIKKLEHDDMLDKNAADYWSKEHDILLERFAKLQVENEKLKDKLENVEPFRSLERTIKEKQRLREEYEEQMRKYNLEKAANEAQHRFIREYAGKDTEVKFNYAICAEGEWDISYTIIHTDDYAKLKEENDRLKDKVHDLEEDVLARQKAYDILDKALQDSQINCNKWYEKWLNSQVEQDCNKNTRADILDQAKKCVCGQREQDYGTPESNFQLIADLWNGYLGEKTDNPVISVTPVDVSMMMALMKIARIRNGGGSGDSFVDLAGYAACGGEIWHGQKVKDQN